MREFKSIGNICIKDNLNIIYVLCKIEYILTEDEKFKYIFTPNYSVIDLLDNNIFQGIPGLNLDLRKDKYVRENITPTFISERVPTPNREDYYELLKEVNMDYMDPIKYLILSDKRYSGDTLFVIDYYDRKTVVIDVDNYRNSIAVIKNIVSNLAGGNNVKINDEIIDDTNRKPFFNIFYKIYEKMYDSSKEKQKEGIEKAKQEKKYKGRKPISVDILKFDYLEEKVEKKEITRQDLMKELGISKDKYYRLRKNSQN